MTSASDYDVVLYGASGFVGRQTVAYFAQHAGALRWALAGRSQAKLEQVRQHCGAQDLAGIIVADGQDEAALDALARQTRVVLSTAGPFALYGSALVAACVRHGAHYVDITGETPWVRDLIERHHAKAEKAGTRIVPLCGFDSVPSDLGAFMVQREMRRRHGQPCVAIKACFSARGGLNGGTLASALNLMDSGQSRALSDLFLLNPKGSQPKRQALDADPIAPHRDSDFSAWVGPFVMGPVNTRVVRRSAALLGYGDDFHYQEYMRFGRGAPAALAAAGVSFGMGATQAAMLLSPVRSLARKMAPAPGQGPSERAMDNGWFRCELVGHSASGETVRALISDQGDPGNRATTKMLCESALALAHQEMQLPRDGGIGGVLTPASALGAVLEQRLRAAGMNLEILA